MESQDKDVPPCFVGDIRTKLARLASITHHPPPTLTRYAPKRHPYQPSFRDPS